MKSDLDLLEQIAIAQARQSFWAFRQYINPKMLRGWWQKEIALELQQFYNDLKNDKKPMLVIQAPPQHGKSYQVIDFIAWLTGLNPDNKIIYTSFSERLGVRANLRLQRIYDSAVYKKIFPETVINERGVHNSDYSRNRELIEFINTEGFFRNTTVRGSITGESLDLGIIDDPIKGREEATSIAVRNKTWDWFTDDFFTRFAENAGLLCILTRWHLDDPIGRLLESDMGFRVKLLNYPAIAIENEKNRKKGDVLFPEHKSLDFIMRRKEAMSDASFESLYQQNPMPDDTLIFNAEWFNMWLSDKALPAFDAIYMVVDGAFSEKQSADFSCILTLGIFTITSEKEDKRAVMVLDCVMERLNYPDLKDKVLQCLSNTFGSNECEVTAVIVEDKQSGSAIIPELKRSNVPVIPYNPAKSGKIERCHMISPLVRDGLVWLPESKRKRGQVMGWLSEWWEQVRYFPNVKHDDGVDCLSMGLIVLNKMGFLRGKIVPSKPAKFYMKRSGGSYGTD